MFLEDSSLIYLQGERGKQDDPGNMNLLSTLSSADLYASVHLIISARTQPRDHISTA